MDDLELITLFVGYGYQPRIVEYGASQSDPARDVQVNKDMAVSMEWAYSEIRKIQNAARSGEPIDKPRWPVILLRTPKGWTGPKKLDDNVIEGNWRSHQVPLPQAGKDDEQFGLLKDWLESYHIQELVNAGYSSHEGGAHDPSSAAQGLINPTALRIVPQNIERRMGMLAESYKGYTPLDLADWKEFGREADRDFSAMKAVGSYLADTIKRNPKTFRIFSPDELSSNKLDETLQVSHRNFQVRDGLLAFSYPLRLSAKTLVEQWDPETAHSGGRVIEMLSEHTLQGFMQGYTL
jgi:xylulose-5-phosphate/fructose-6-phosphate phosphoketolase